MNFQIHALPPEVLERVRASRVDVSGTPIEQVTAEGGEPLRCCLRNARPGEALLLFGYEPPIGKSPYREVGAVFAHAVSCGGRQASGEYPAVMHGALGGGAPRSLRADNLGKTHGATLLRMWVDVPDEVAANAEAEIARLLQDPEAVQLHSRNVAYGCFMFVVTRS